ncbi:HesA/MoeB/ThiF family protein [Micromonospora antibiotica]|uniref:ThiF family adenylyltransferase n=1 Tax=Micromonospora antibiotica TaxID=2807623 RepID=A0ABS3V7A3_9ACTN|nr:ThiF family adenylyltransferase [Micromonospora antibiotica]MBO4161459.1 ThiF family adenylyltransferase [Micromonospora antibiotica]
MPILTMPFDGPAPPTGATGPIQDRYDRQVRAFGRLAELTVAVVGLGGVGSQVVQSLAHLGVGGLLLVDPDTVTATNLNRLIGAKPADVARAATKVTVAARTVRTINPQVRVRGIAGSILDPVVWQQVRPAEVIVGAVDGHAPRWALNRLAVQYARCYLDVGVELGPAPRPEQPDDHDQEASSRVRLEAGGHLAVIRPGGPCLLCLCGYDPRLVDAELDPGLAAARRAAGYRVDDPAEPAPSVVFLNQIIAGYAVGELLNYVSLWRPPVRYLLVDAAVNGTTALDADRDPQCLACGPDSPRGLSDAAGPPSVARTTAPPAAHDAAGAPQNPNTQSSRYTSPSEPGPRNGSHHHDT